MEPASVKEVLKVLESIEHEHCVVVYRDNNTFRKIYSQHIKRQVEKNEMVILLPYYETVDQTRVVLNQAGINVKALERDGFLVLLDSYAACLGFKQDSELFFSRLPSHAVVSKKSSICIIADMGVFFLIKRVAEIGSGRIRIKGFCTYHQRDFDMLSESQKAAIFGEGYKALLVQQTS